MQKVNALGVTSDLCMLQWRQLIIVPEGAVGPTPVAMGQHTTTHDRLQDREWLILCSYIIQES